MRKPSAIAAVLAFAGILVASTTFASPWDPPGSEQGKLIASDEAQDDLFGSSVSISGTTAVIGAHGNDDNGSSSGSAYVREYDGSTWSEQKILASDPGASDFFGRSVSIGSGSIIVGAKGEWANRGAAYVFRHNGSDWSEVVKLTSNYRTEDYKYATSVAIYGDDALVGAHGYSSFGGAFLHHDTGSGWDETILKADDRAVGDYFGASVAIDNGRAAIAATHDSDDGSRSGSVYIFEDGVGGWSEEAKLTADDAVAYDYFGNAVAVLGDIVVVGAQNKNSATGAVYVFQKGLTEWTQVVKLTASDGQTGDLFGTSVAISGDSILVGAWGCDGEGDDVGAAYLFQDSGAGWQEVAKLTGADTEEDDQLGMSVGMSTDLALLSSPKYDGIGADSGAVYVFEPGDDAIPGDADGNGKVDGADLAVWQRNYDPIGLNPGNDWSTGDWDDNDKVDGADLALWQRNYDPVGSGFGGNAVPEPGTLLLVGTGIIGIIGIIRRRRIK